MAAVAFDTLKAARRLIAAGMPTTQAEAQAEVMAEAFVFNMDALVTRDYLDARLSEHDVRIDARFAEQDARIDARFTKQDAYIDARFTEQGNRIDLLRNDIDGKFRLVFWMLTALIGAVFPVAFKLLF